MILHNRYPMMVQTKTKWASTAWIGVNCKMQIKYVALDFRLNMMSFKFENVVYPFDEDLFFDMGFNYLERLESNE